LWWDAMQCPLLLQGLPPLLMLLLLPVLKLLGAC
jgi:hypothetical protein